ncbi:cyclic AMP response element-binding protein B isoform X4 [Pectinophora gossypiella]|uniref:cyclic AMP response element-binding protein B isoform X4 n=1 Tax=Pectinophora gossypiella TaxID=13191 RepID=UPI00214DFE85|nr:cyclic AMP response element-binding protein B isoform X4 [Pectinophora gossypiella]
MDGMVEENGTSTGASADPLGGAGGAGGSGAPMTAAAPAHVVAVTSIVQLTLPTQAPSAQVQSVIQPNQQSVIQTASNIQSVQLPKGNVILVSKPSSVIHTTQGTLQTLQIKPEPNTLVSTQGQSCSDESCSDDDSPKRKYREMLTRRPSYRKILNDLGGAEIAVIPAGALQAESGLHTLAVSGAAGGGAIVQYANQDGQFYVPEDQTRKREMRLLKNREAARECRRKKKEYIKCLENRVAVLENQNKALIEELKTLKELYCQQKTE